MGNLYKDYIEDLDNLRTEKVELYKDKSIEVEKLFNRQWLCFKDMPIWNIRNHIVLLNKMLKELKIL